MGSYKKKEQVLYITERGRERETDRQMDRDRDRQTDTHTKKERDRERDTHTDTEREIDRHREADRQREQALSQIQTLAVPLTLFAFRSRRTPGWTAADQGSVCWTRLTWGA